MGCPSQAKIDENLTFSICTHDPDTGVLTDADGAPTYRVYEDDTGTAILNGDMAKLDDDNTTGFYVKKIAVTAANGFAIGQSYTVYIEATVDSDKGGICYAFRVPNDLSAAQVNAEVVDTLNVDTYAEPGQEAPAATNTLTKKIGYLFKAWRNKATQTVDTYTLFADNGTTTDQKATVSDDETTFTKGEVGTGA